MQILSFLLARFSEPSSYAGLGAILALAGLHFSDSDIGQIAQFLPLGAGWRRWSSRNAGLSRRCFSRSWSAGR
jgi:hypothetical protein